MPGLMEILTRVAEAWKSNKRELIESSDKVVKAIERESAMEAKKRDITKEDISTAYEMLSDSFDPIYGGFSHAPKFPTPHNMYFL